MPEALLKQAGQQARPLSTEAGRKWAAEHAEVHHKIAELKTERRRLAGRGGHSAARDRITQSIREHERWLKVRGFVDGQGGVWYFDRYAGDRVIRWIEHYCVHKKGEWRGKPLKLGRWQRKIVRQLFGWKDADGLRRFTEAWIEIARKNGKSTLAAAIALYLFCGDREPAAEVYSVAGSRDQAALVFNDAKSMVELNPDFSDEIDVTKFLMLHGRTDSKFECLGTKNQHGLNPSGAVGDEVHEWKKRDQYEAITSADGVRRQPLFLFITTAGHDLFSLCGELHRRAKQVAAGHAYQPELYVRIYTVPAGADWKDRKFWPLANPGMAYGAPKVSALDKAFRKALGRPAEENSFKRLRLNMWTDTLSAWITSETWDQAKAEIDFSALAGADCYAGLDLALKWDLSALSLLFPPGNPVSPDHWLLGCCFWCPEDNIKAREDADGVSYRDWTERGLLKATPGNTTDFDVVENDIKALGRHFNILGLGFDAHLAHQMIQHFEDDGVPCVEVPQTITTLAHPTVELERMIFAGELKHGGHEIMGWNVGNTVVVHNSNGEYRPHKGKSGGKIDGVIGAINALAVAMAGDQEESIDGFLSNPIVVSD